MTSILRKAITVAAALAALAPAAAAASPPSYPKRTFAVTVEGVQTTKSGYTHTSSGPCDPAGTASASERVVFRSTKPKIVDATDFAPLVLFGHGRPGDHTFSATATVTRRSSYTHGPVDPTCEDAGGGATAHTPDCGTSRVRLPIEMDWYNPKGIVLRSPDLDLPRSPFFTCPVDGLVFPYLLDSANHGRHIIARIPASDLFDKRWKKHILLGGGTFSTWSDGGGYTTSIRWTVTLTAVHPS